MFDSEYLHYEEINDLTFEGKLGERTQYTQKENSHVQSTPTGISSTSISAFTSFIPAIVSVLVVATAIAVVTFKAPTVTLSDWIITNQSISAVFEGEVIDNPYVISLMSANQTIYSYDVLDESYLISFDGLSPESSYDLMIEADYGIGLQKIKEIHIMTGGNPVYKKGRIKITSHEIDYPNSEIAIHML